MVKRATMKDIAAEAEVSVSTVSLVLSGKIGTRVSAETVERIREIAERLHYQPDVSAQRLKGKESSTIGLIIPNITNYFYSEMTKGVMDEGTEAGYQVVLFNSDNHLKTEQFAVETLISMRAAGVIVCGIHETKDAEQELLVHIKKSGIPVIKIDRCEWDGNWPCVCIDNYKAAYDCVEHLYQIGHRKIALLASMWDLNIINDRERGFRQAMKDFGLFVSEDSIFRTDSLDFIDKAADKLAKRMIADLKKYTAVLVIPGDLLAIECIDYWKKHGVKIPEDISVMGFDNIYMGSVIEPSLTTVNQPKYDMGREAMRLLLSMINGEEAGTTKRIFEHEVIVRNSTRVIQHKD